MKNYTDSLVELDEAFSGSQYPIAVQKMRAFNNGTRKENLRACGDQKLVDYYDICIDHQFNSAKAKIEAELRSRGMNSFIKITPAAATTQTAPNTQPLSSWYDYTENDFQPVDAQFIKDNTNNINAIVANVFGAQNLSVDEKLKFCVSEIILALAIKEPNVAEQLKNVAVKIIPIENIKYTINKTLSNPVLAKRLADIRVLLTTKDESLQKNTITEDVEKHTELNPKLWNEDHTLKGEVKDKINEIVKNFIDGLEDKEIKYKLDDIKLVGSNCSFNYNKDSDLDIHLVFDLNIYDDAEKQEMAEIIYDYARGNWNNNYDVYFYDIPVEIFVETNNTEQLNDEQPVQEAKQKTALKSNGVYSVMNDAWIKEPVAEDIPDIDKEAFEKELKVWEDEAKELLDSSKENLSEEFSGTITEVIELPDFEDTRKELLISDNDIEAAKQAIINTPNIGDRIQGGNGARKLRIAIESNNKGKPGGARAAYLNYYIEQKAYLIDIILKSDQSDFTPKQIKQIAKVVDIIKYSNK